MFSDLIIQFSSLYPVLSVAPVLSPFRALTLQLSMILAVFTECYQGYYTYHALPGPLGITAACCKTTIGNVLNGD